MKWILIALLSLVAAVGANGKGGSSRQDPYTLAALNLNNLNANGRTVVSSVPSAPSTTAVVITGGQSLMVSQAGGTYSTTQAGSLNFNNGDGGTYPCANPVLGTQAVTAFTNSPNCIIADNLITGGSYTSVIVAPMAAGASLCADFAPGGVWHHRIAVTVARLAARGLTTASGFAGDVWVVWGQGESDNTAGTARATLATCWRAIAQSFVDAGLGTFRFMLNTQSLAANVTSANVTNSQADSVASGCSTCRAGANVDSLTGGTNRSDGTHMTQTGNASMAGLIATAIANCKASLC